jgi:hypothetical protein
MARSQGMQFASLRGVQELCDPAGSLTLVGDHGAKIRDTLSARASTLRRRQLADAEGKAGEADQSVLAPAAARPRGFDPDRLSGRRNVLAF